ncbi:hypothetical protein C818_02929 [Lachnospiraceae bacterium MD308]|nr:hypothetical protein C818_02929 [Lachnospiraceae bacterium MD308]
MTKERSSILYGEGAKYRFLEGKHVPHLISAVIGIVAFY